MSDFWYLISNSGNDVNVSNTTIINSHVSGANFYSLYTNNCVNGGGNEGWIWSLSLKKFEILPSGVVLRLNHTIQLTSRVIWTNNWVSDVTTSSTWSSSNPYVATVSSTGLVTANNYGKTVISSTYEGRTSTCFIIITSYINDRDNDAPNSFTDESIYE